MKRSSMVLALGLLVIPALAPAVATAKQVEIKTSYFNATFDAASATDSEPDMSWYELAAPAIARSHGAKFQISGRLHWVFQELVQQVRATVTLPAGSSFKVFGRTLQVSQNFKNDVFFSPESIFFGGYLRIESTPLELADGTRILPGGLHEIKNDGSLFLSLAGTQSFKLRGYAGKADVIILTPGGTASYLASDVESGRSAVINGKNHSHVGAVRILANGLAGSVMILKRYSSYYDWWNHRWVPGGYTSSWHKVDAQGNLED